MKIFSELSFIQILTLQEFFILFRYFLVAGLAYAIFWKWLFPKFESKILYQDPPTQTDIKREIFYSVLTSIVFLWTIIGVLALKSLGIRVPGRFYLSISEYGWGWYLTSAIIIFFFHDAFFYWTHRMMHHPKIFKVVHRVHHLSVKPTPFAAYAFHPWEAFIQGWAYFLLALVLPIHWSVAFFFTLTSLLFNVYGHLGFDLFKPETRESFPLKYFEHSTHHAWHHRHVNGNYGLYLRFWDRLMGTWKGELKK